jgi:hypothetical protein
MIELGVRAAGPFALVLVELEAPTRVSVHPNDTGSLARLADWIALDQDRAAAVPAAEVALADAARAYA